MLNVRWPLNGTVFNCSGVKLPPLQTGPPFSNIQRGNSLWMIIFCASIKKGVARSHRRLLCPLFSSSQRDFAVLYAFLGWSTFSTTRDLT